MPQQSVMNEIMEKHLGKAECFSYYKLSQVLFLKII